MSRSVHPIAQRVTTLATTHAGVIAAVAIAVLVGVLFGILARAIDPGDRVQIGNTAGSLSILVEVGEGRILVGAGPSRSHAADFIGRSTRPWDRRIDLLILPGWDEFHASGALGLLERRDVSGIAVIGLPGDDPIWTLLEREADRQDIPMRYLSGAHQLGLGDEAELTLLTLEDNDAPAGAWIRLDLFEARFDLLDTANARTVSAPPGVMPHRNEHVIVNMRTGGIPAESQATILARPAPFFSSQFDDHDAPYVANIARNERVVIRVSPQELRIPLEVFEIER